MRSPPGDQLGAMSGWRSVVKRTAAPRSTSTIATSVLPSLVLCTAKCCQSGDADAYDRIVPRAGYYRYLHALVENGFGKRIMFASDFPDRIAMGIDAIVAADFLSAEQKADILCNNAARFLRLEAAICRP
jgi:hypothetical protein